MAKGLESSHLPCRRQTRAAVLFVFNEGRPLCRELLKHSRNGSLTHTKMISEGVAGPPFLFRAAQFQYGFQIIVDRFGVIAARWHLSIVYNLGMPKILLAMQLIALLAMAQGETTSAIVGSVSDPTGAGIHGAIVSVTSIENGLKRSLKTDDS